jgi:hypothetical protein
LGAFSVESFAQISRDTASDIGKEDALKIPAAQLSQSFLWEASINMETGFRDFHSS